MAWESIPNMGSWRSRKLLPWLMASLALALLVLGVWQGPRLWQASRPQPEHQLIIALPAQLASGAFYVANEQRLFEKHHLRVKLRPFKLGREALQSVISGNSDLALLADTPLALAILRGESLAALGTVYEARQALALVARVDRGIHSGRDLAGKTVGTAFGTNAQRFLDLYLEEQGLGKDQPKIVDLPAEQLVTALETGSVDAVTVWHPDRARLQTRLAKGASIDLLPQIPFIYRFVLAGRPEQVLKDQAAIVALLQALQEANEVMGAHPDIARNLVAQSLGLEPAALGAAFLPRDYVLHLQPSLIQALEDQGRWAMARGIVPPRPLPDFGKSIDARWLRQVAQGSVSLP